MAEGGGRDNAARISSSLELSLSVGKREKEMVNKRPKIT